MKLFQSKPKDAGAAIGGPGASMKPSRRGLMVGAGAASAVVVVSGVLRTGTSPVAASPAVPGAATPSGDGYQVTQHVLRYYETAKV